jgi:hypothetical protein
MNNPTKKLGLNQEALRNLTQRELQKVAGGFGNQTCHTCEDCQGTHTCTDPTSNTCACTQE